MMYHIKRMSMPPDECLPIEHDHACWSRAERLMVDQFHPRSSSHRPFVETTVLYDHRGLHLRFHVHDRYVRSAETGYQARVSGDSCVEFFAQPLPESGYFNFEMSCGGTLLLYYIEDPQRGADAPFAKYTPVPEELGASVQIRATLPPIVMPERTEPTTWSLCCFIPFSVFEAFVGSLGQLPGQTWRGNFFKCADHCSHPHWASWAPIGEELRFHQPKYFAPIVFDR